VTDCSIGLADGTLFPAGEFPRQSAFLTLIGPRRVSLRRRDTGILQC
jgi:hypothetical protein